MQAKGRQSFKTVMIIYCRNVCVPLLLPVSAPWDEVCATQCDFAAPLFKIWSLLHQSLTLAGSMTCTVQLKWQKQCGATSKLRLQETYLLLLIHWAPCLCHLNKPQANKKKTKGKREGSSQMSPRYVRQPSQDWQSWHTANHKPMNKPSGGQNWAAESNLRCHGIKMLKIVVVLATNFWGDLLLSNS